MAEVVRNLKKLGAKNREIRESVNEAMKSILEMRAKKEQERLAQFAARKLAQTPVETTPAEPQSN